MLLEKQGGSVTATYTYGNALLRKDGEPPLFDGLGSERTVTNSSGTVTDSLVSTAFGQPVTTVSSTDAYQWGATSGYCSDGDGVAATPSGDDENGLVKVGCRYYDPETGRFTTRDTDLSQSAYVYCDGDPVNATDPSGHWSLFGLFHAWLVINAAVGMAVLVLAAGAPVVLAIVVGCVFAYLVDGVWEKYTGGDGFMPHST